MLKEDVLSSGIISEASHNWICWIILIVAFFSYQLLWADFFKRKHNTTGQTQTQLPSHSLAHTLINVLPLLGLLGTIIGLLQCFAAIASDGDQANVLSDGISKALITTQLGLVCAIPGWLLQRYLRRGYLYEQLYEQQHDQQCNNKQSPETLEPTV